MESIYNEILQYYKDREPAGASHVYKLPIVAMAPPGVPAGLKPVISVVNADVLDTALDEAAAGHRAVMLNMANPDMPGGYPHLFGAQEEDLFRRTNLHKYLNYRMYPIHRKCILSTNVEVLRAGVRRRYALLEAPSTMDVLTCAAVRNEAMSSRLSPVHARTMYDKIYGIFHVAATHGYDTVVVSAFGCGGFQCPPGQVAGLFRCVIDDQFHGVFRAIVFAIWDEGYPMCNHRIFKQKLCEE